MEKIAVLLDSQLLASVVDLISKVDLDKYAKKEGDRLDNCRKIISFYQWSNDTFGYEAEKESILYIKGIIFSELEDARIELHKATKGGSDDEVDHSFISEMTIKYNKILHIYNEFSKAIEGEGWF
ncbi:hypothetical protein [Bacillus atrophaeus]|uniref:hypothetical protein n=1 Tax=Bacillus atrophaeus TaxID=1452 RepID=UPI002E1E3DA6|nr:hypothetical protein [Bacillus atrophaeus]